MDRRARDQELPAHIGKQLDAAIPNVNSNHQRSPLGLIVLMISVTGVRGVDAISDNLSLALNDGDFGMTCSAGDDGHDAAHGRQGPSTPCAPGRWNASGRRHVAECATNFLRCRKYA
jgi:hypothetical protein